MTIIVRMPSGRVVEHNFNTKEEADEFKADLHRLRLACVVIGEQK